MKKYTVKEVIKLEDRYEKLKEKSKYDNHVYACDFSQWLLGGAGIGMVAAVGKMAPLDLTILVTSLFAIGSGAIYLDSLTASARKAGLEHKLEEIYRMMGPEFEEAVALEKEGRVR